MVSVWGERGLRAGLSPYWAWDSCQRAAGQAGLLGRPPLSGITLPTLSMQKLPSLTQLPGQTAWPCIIRPTCRPWLPVPGNQAQWLLKSSFVFSLFFSFLFKHTFQKPIKGSSTSTPLK